MIFLSHLISQVTPLYGNNGNFSLNPSTQMSQGDSSNSTELVFPAHSGTHIDAPYHFDPVGKSLETYPPDFWICHHPFLLEYSAQPDEIFELEQWEPLLQTIPPETDILIIKTGFEKLRISQDDPEPPYIFHGPGIGPGIGHWLRKNRKLKMIGFDFISLTSYSNRSLGRIAHRAFLAKSSEDDADLGAPILIIEDMKLSELQTHPKQVIVAPLRYENSDGAPVTVLAHA